jgi:hypothetical protein
MNAAFNRFIRQVLTPTPPMSRCVACGKPGPAVCPGCERSHDYVREVEQRRSVGSDL